MKYVFITPVDDVVAVFSMVIFSVLFMFLFQDAEMRRAKVPAISNPSCCQRRIAAMFVEMTKGKSKR